MLKEFLGLTAMMRLCQAKEADGKDVIMICLGEWRVLMSGQILKDPHVPQSRAPNVLTYSFMHPFIHPAKPVLTAYQALLQTLSG